MPDRPTPRPWGPDTHQYADTLTGRVYYLSATDYRAACRAVNREPAGEELAEAAAGIGAAEGNGFLCGGCPECLHGEGHDTNCPIGDLLEALAAWEAAGKEGGVDGK